MLRKIRKKKSSAVPLFRSGHMSAICARLGSKGKVGVQRGRETAGVPSFLPPRRAPHSPALRRAQLPTEVQRKTPRPLGANTLTQFVHPGQSVQKKGAAQTGRTACAVRAPRSIGAEKECHPDWANRLRSSCTPVDRCRKRVPPRLDEPPARFVRPVKRVLCKSKFPKENPHAIG